MLVRAAAHITAGCLPLTPVRRVEASCAATNHLHPAPSTPPAPHARTPAFDEFLRASNAQSQPVEAATLAPAPYWQHLERENLLRPGTVVLKTQRTALDVLA